MQKKHHKVIIASVAVLLITGAVSAIYATSASAMQDIASESAEGSPVANPETQVFELRVYTAAPGKLEDLNKRFRDHTLRLFEKHGITSIGYWTSIDEKSEGRLYYIVSYPDLESREKMLVNGIAKDPQFRKVVAESEADGKLTTEIESVLLKATDYSPIK